MPRNPKAAVRRATKPGAPRGTSPLSVSACRNYARTGERLGDFTVRVTGQRERPPGPFAESARVRTPSPWRGAGEAPGLYAVRVTRPGYVPWDSAGVRLSADVCHVIPVRLRVTLALADRG